MKAGEILRKQSPVLIALLGSVAVLLLGALDYKLPFELTLFMFYTCPILFVAWYGNRGLAVGLAMLCTIVWWAANLHTQPFTQQSFAWAAFNRLVLLVIVAWGGAAMSTQREALRSRLEALERTRVLEEEIVRVSEREKNRLGQDLHDGVCQDLAAIDCAMACLQLDLEEKHAPEAKAAAFIQTQLNRAMVEARDLARGIFPVQIAEEGFEAALEELVATTNRLRQMRVHLHVEGEIKIKEPQTAMHLYRIAQEAVSNAGKHARATEVHISLRDGAEGFRMGIADNGVGMPAPRIPSAGLGLQTMNYRAHAMGGTLTLSPQSSGGTLVECGLPPPA